LRATDLQDHHVYHSSEHEEDLRHRFPVIHHEDESEYEYEQRPHGGDYDYEPKTYYDASTYKRHAAKPTYAMDLGDFGSRKPAMAAPKVPQVP